MLNTVYFLCQPYGKPFFPGALALLLKNGIRNQDLGTQTGVATLEDGMEVPQEVQNRATL